MTEADIQNWTSSSLSNHGFEDCFIYDIRIAGNRVNVFIESDTSVTYEICRKVSRDIESYLDEMEWMGGKYTLEVSSPGVGSPLKFSRQYLKNIGRTIEVKYGDQKVRGLLTRADDKSIDVSYKERVKEGKKKVTKEIVDTIQLETIREAKIKVTF